MRAGWGIVALVFFVAFDGTAGAQGLAPQLGPERLRRIEELRTGPFRGRNLEALEREYQELVQRQTFADLITLYSRENESRLEITYPSFTAESSLDAGPDLGFGLHVVKKLRLALPDGREKIIVVNEQWPESRREGGLFLPDEIRIKTLAMDGERHVEGSERLYLFDSIRLAWGPAGEISIQRRTRYRWEPQTKRARLRTMRVPVSAPISCLGCHHAPTAFTPPFIEAGAPVDHEAIVQDSYFRKKLDDTIGFREYMAHLGAQERDAGYIEAVREALLRPLESLRVPGIVEALRQHRGAFSWLGDDGGGYGVSPEELFTRQGVYRSHGELYVDALEEVFEGKYRWWEPLVVVPAVAPRK